MSPSCSGLVFSWFLTVGGLALFGYFGRVGLLLGFPLLIVAQRIRQDHDLSALERYKQSPSCMKFVLGYYFFVLGLGTLALMQHRDILDINFAVLMVIFFFPVILGMLVADHKACSAGREGRA